MNHLKRIRMSEIKEIRNSVLLALIKLDDMSSLDVWRRILKEAPKSQMRPSVPANASPAMLCDLEQRTEPRSLRLITHANKQRSKLPNLLKVFSYRWLIQKWVILPSWIEPHSACPSSPCHIIPTCEMCPIWLRCSSNNNSRCGNVCMKAWPAGSGSLIRPQWNFFPPG